MATASHGVGHGPVGVVGAGTMGAGIAQAAAQAGSPVRLYDLEDRFLDRARGSIEQSLGRSVERGRTTAEEASAVRQRLSYTTDLSDFRDCHFVVEAAPEDLPLKLSLFQRLHDACSPDAILATNTSSLSVTEIGRGSGRPELVIGMHFFNPPTAMRLVELVRGAATAPPTVDRLVAFARGLGKTPIVCIDTPGFVVNRIARPFYLQGLQILGEGAADVETIDTIVRSAGFPMGPFQLMDLIGLDINFTATRSIYEQRFHEPRLKPHLIQQALVAAGDHGRKTGRGFYDYAAEPPTVRTTRPGERVPAPGVDWHAWDQVAGAEGAPIVGRVLSAVINEAYFALGEGVASATDIDTGMRLGTNYPKGPIAWGDEIGLGAVLDTLLQLDDWYRDGRYMPAPLLRSRVAKKRP